MTMDADKLEAVFNMTNDHVAKDDDKQKTGEQKTEEQKTEEQKTSARPTPREREHVADENVTTVQSHESRETRTAPDQAEDHTSASEPANNATAGDAATPLFTPSAEDVQVHWAGPLLIVPIEQAPDDFAGPSDVRLTLTGAPAMVRHGQSANDSRADDRLSRQQRPPPRRG